MLPESWPFPRLLPEDAGLGVLGGVVGGGTHALNVRRAIAKGFPRGFRVSVAARRGFEGIHECEYRI